MDIKEEIIEVYAAVNGPNIAVPTLVNGDTTHGHGYKDDKLDLKIEDLRFKSGVDSPELIEIDSDSEDDLERCRVKNTSATIASHVVEQSKLQETYKGYDFSSVSQISVESKSIKLEVADNFTQPISEDSEDWKENHVKTVGNLIHDNGENVTMSNPEETGNLWKQYGKPSINVSSAKETVCQRMQVRKEEEDVEIVLEIINDFDGEVEEVLPEVGSKPEDHDAEIPVKHRDYSKGGTVHRPTPEEIGQNVVALYTKTNCWIPGVIESILPVSHEVEHRPSFSIQFKGCSGTAQELLPMRNMAYDEVYYEVLPGNLNIRVVAKLQRLRACGCDFENAPHYYPGMIAKMPPGNKHTRGSKYLIFFDNGQACLVKHRDIKVMCSGGVEDFTTFQLERKLVPDLNYSEMFLKSYPWEFRLKRKCKGDVVIAWQAGKWRMARVIKRDEEIVKVQFEGKDKLENLFIGSPRFLKVFKEYLGRRLGNLSSSDLSQILDELSQFVGFEGSVEKSNIPNILTPGNIVITYDPSIHPKFISPLAIPFYFGWKCNEGVGNKRTYITPTGTICASYADIAEYLKVRETNLHVDWFCFKTGISCRDLFKANRGSFNFTLEDISFGEEKIPVPCRNTVDNVSFPKLTYSSKLVIREDVKKPDDKESMTCCDCTDDCLDKNKCACWQLTLRGLEGIVTEKMLQESGYKDRKLLDARFISEIYECNERCKCRKDMCSNWVVQNGLQWPLEVFKTKHKNWAVRAMCDIPKGSFICQYVGELRTDKMGSKDAEKFGGEYLLDLNFVKNLQEEASWNTPGNEIQSQDNKHDDGNDLSEGRKRKCRKLVNAPVSKKSLLKESHFVINPKKKGNVGRFFNHSCQPNMFAQGVFVDTHDIRFPVVAFFTKKDVKAGEELTWDYGYKFEKGSSIFKCHCGADKCKGRDL